MITLEGQLTKALTEMDSTSRLHLFTIDNEEIIIKSTDILLIGGESIKIVERLKNRTNRGRVKIIAYDSIDHIYYTVNETIYNKYANAGATPQEIDENNIPKEGEEVKIGDVVISITDNNNNNISDAIVLLTRLGQTYEGTSDETGNCTIENLPYGDYELTISHDGYNTLNSQISLNVDFDLEDFTLTPINTPSEEDVETGEIQFTIRNTSNVAISGATVKLSNNDVELTGTSDIDGNVSIENIPYGEYTLIISADGYTTLSEEYTLDVDFDIDDFKLSPVSSDEDFDF